MLQTQTQLLVFQAVEASRSVCGFSSKIEVECRSAEEGREAAGAGADIVMLDNFRPQVGNVKETQSRILFSTVKPVLCHLQELHVAARALKEEFPALLIEASGGISPENIALYFSSHVDIISLGCITQGCPVVDFSLKVQKPQTGCIINRKLID